MPGGWRLGAVLEAHEHRRPRRRALAAVELDRFFAAAVEEQIGLDLHGVLLQIAIGRSGCYLFAICARMRSSCSRSSGVNSAPKSSASNTWRISISDSVPGNGLGQRLTHSIASSFDLTWHIQKPATSSFVSGERSVDHGALRTGEPDARALRARVESFARKHARRPSPALRCTCPFRPGASRPEGRPLLSSCRFDNHHEPHCLASFKWYCGPSQKFSGMGGDSRIRGRPLVLMTCSARPGHPAQHVCPGDPASGSCLRWHRMPWLFRLPRWRYFFFLRPLVFTFFSLVSFVWISRR